MHRGKLGSCSGAKDKFGPIKAEPRTAAPFKENAQNQILYIIDVCGVQHLDGREQAMESLRDRGGGASRVSAALVSQRLVGSNDI